MTDTVIESTIDAIVLTSSDATSVVSVEIEDRTTVVSAGTQGPTGGQGPVGPAGPISNGQFAYTAGVPLSGHRVVTVDDNGQAIYANAATLSHMNKILGMTTGAASAASSVNVQLIGEFTEGSWNWSLNQPIYLGLNGALTQAVPETPSSVFSIVVAFPISATKILLNLREPILIA